MRILARRQAGVRSPQSRDAPVRRGVCGGTAAEDPVDTNEVNQPKRTAYAHWLHTVYRRYEPKPSFGSSRGR